MRLDVAERRQRDADLLRSAGPHEALGEELIASHQPAAVTKLRARCETGNLGSRTRGPWRLGLRAIAKEHACKPALGAFQRADRAYWAVVTQWSSLVHKLAIRDEQRFHLASGELRGAYFLAAYETAIRLDPDQSNFGTYFGFWRRQFLARAPEVLTTVHGDIARNGLAACISGIQSTDVASTAKGDLLIERMEGVYTDALDTLAHDPARVMPVIGQYLTHRQRQVLAVLRVEDNYPAVGAHFGLTREWVRQKRNEILKVAQEVLSGQPPERPCLWPGCRVKHHADGLCLQHASRLGPEEYAVFVGRLPTVNEVASIAARSRA